MMRGKITIFIYIFISAFCLFILFSTGESAGVPKAEIKSTIDAIIEVLKDKNLSLSASKEERRSKIRTLISGRFDFEEMSKRILARRWKKRTDEEKKEFVSIFSKLLEASYIGKFEAYTDEKVIYGKEVIRGGGKYGAVSTTIATKKVDIPIDYKVILKDSKWWIYDIVIEGVSFISTYRSQYNEVIVKKSFAELIQQMKNKLNEVNALMDKKPVAEK
ncbi:MAG: ABC transporter substrate-binding protein [Candidatus Mariimomonas ferrooxydans]